MTAIKRPILILSYFLDYKLWQNNAAGYHLTNLLIHILNCALLFYAVKAISNSTVFSSITTVLFALHPIQVEAVTWITGRNELLLALFTKESAIFLLLLFITYDMYFSTNVKRPSLNYIGFILIATLYFCIRYFVVCGLEAGGLGTFNLFISNIVTAPLYYLNYLKLFFYPAGYSFNPTLLFASHLKFWYTMLTVAGFSAAFLAFRNSKNTDIRVVVVSDRAFSVHGHIPHAVAIDGTPDVSSVDRNLFLHGMRNSLSSKEQCEDY